MPCWQVQPREVLPAGDGTGATQTFTEVPQDTRGGPWRSPEQDVTLGRARGRAGGRGPPPLRSQARRAVRALLTKPGPPPPAQASPTCREARLLAHRLRTTPLPMQTPLQHGRLSVRAPRGAPG